ncbi:MAG: heme ABC exporter ATP-binding protein CcmA [Chloroflexi bacterium]|nr:heme ABC exporter ATP-binding protein CcmA [Chloroflexota bacterium]MDL1941102.1 heme ABC exporter ATP-binding protein CcmA [Chloroflexi bacterium CFX2]
MIEVKKLVKRFGLKTVLRGLDFRVEPGEFVALLGPNGAGKTTFLRILASLSRPSMGSVKVAGHSLPHESAQVRARLGVVSHMPLLYPDLTAEENLQFYARMYGLANSQLRITEVLNMVGLEPRRKDLVRTFSRGMQQRLAIGRAILHDPEVVLFDEPYTGLDQDASEMLDEVLRSVAAKGRTVVMTSHDLARAEDLATRFDILSRGVIAASAAQEELKNTNLLAFYKQSLEIKN